MPGDFELLVQMLANLVENAIGHTPEGSRIALMLRQDGDGAIHASAESAWVSEQDLGITHLDSA